MSTAAAALDELGIGRRERANMRWKVVDLAPVTGNELTSAVAAEDDPAS